MQNIFLPLGDLLADSLLRSLAIDWLRNIPGLPPILQSIHILAVAVVMASAVLIHLRSLGIAVSQQTLAELYQRMRLWFWFALPVLFFSGILFIFARPYRYFKNPVFGLKLLFIALAITMTWWIFHTIKRQSMLSKNWAFKLTNALALVCWLLVIFAGRWIAYAEYLFPR
ncbi:hypothetical protein NBRC116494_01040 [Aurantivibrio plasticivorans]